MLSECELSSWVLVMMWDDALVVYKTSSVMTTLISVSLLSSVDSLVDLSHTIALVILHCFHLCEYIRH